MSKILVLLFITITSISTAQDKVYNTFRSTRTVNSHSVDMLGKKQGDFRITHRFGDIAGANGGIHSLFGIDEAADIRIATEYGINDNLNIGVGRSKGVSPYSGLFDGYIKYRFLQQTTDGSVPVSITLVSTVNLSTGRLGTNPHVPNTYTDFPQRLSYTSQLLIGRKFSERFSLQIMPSYAHRNFVAYDDVNSLFALGGATYIKVNKLIAILLESYYIVNNDKRTYLGSQFYVPLALGVEFDTGGHVFHVNLTNSMGITETQFIPYTLSDLSRGQYRLGFTISRIFKF
ncbi:MAG: DUF5777 family beta-barrel protein [Flavobacteriales bacterium]